MWTDKHYYIFADGEHFVNGVKTPRVDLISEWVMSEEEALEAFDKIIELLTNPTWPFLDEFFGGCDYKYYSRHESARGDGLLGIRAEFIDAMGQQAYSVIAVSDEDLTDYILDCHKRLAVGGVLELPEEKTLTTPWGGDGESIARTYKPLNIICRVDDDGFAQYDVECDRTEPDEDKPIIWVENLECVGILILYNIYRALIGA